jgi:hypothetical protein
VIYFLYIFWLVVLGGVLYLLFKLFF